MFFSRKIYFNNKPLVLTADAGIFKNEHPEAGGYLTFSGALQRNYRLAFDHLNLPGTFGAIIEDISPEALLDEIHKLYQPIDAAGGVVEDELGRILMIFRRNRWDLPKGKCDDGEELSLCALREVSEETGLKKIQLRHKICDTYHIYSQFNQKLLKTTAWYAMAGSKEELLVPQSEESISEVRWISIENLGPVVFKSYEAIREVLLEAGYKW